ncbi:MAG: hypothetical protein C4554_02130 [Dethiobacter sp.]|nr:MAG: hypothetical protein C4554_02130 [Dethiobacter sp.]
MPRKRAPTAPQPHNLYLYALYIIATLLSPVNSIIFLYFFIRFFGFYPMCWHGSQTPAGDHGRELCREGRRKPKLSLRAFHKNT